MVAGRDIYTGAGNPGLNTVGTNSGNITLIAGADYSETDTQITINGANLSGNGGKIDLAPLAGTAIQQIDASSGSGTGGDVNMVAYAGSLSNSGTDPHTDQPNNPCQWRRC